MAPRLQPAATSTSRRGELTRREAALIAAVLPNPRIWSPARPTGYIRQRARTIERRMGQLGPLLDCVR